MSNSDLNAVLYSLERVETALFTLAAEQPTDERKALVMRCRDAMFAEMCEAAR